MFNSSKKSEMRALEIIEQKVECILEKAGNRIKPPRISKRCARRAIKNYLRCALRLAADMRALEQRQRDLAGPSTRIFTAENEQLELFPENLVRDFRRIEAMGEAFESLIGVGGGCLVKKKDALLLRGHAQTCKNIVEAFDSLSADSRITEAIEQHALWAEEIHIFLPLAFDEPRGENWCWAGISVFGVSPGFQQCIFDLRLKEAEALGAGNLSVRILGVQFLLRGESKIQLWFRLRAIGLVLDSYRVVVIEFFKG